MELRAATRSLNCKYSIGKPRFHWQKTAFTVLKVVEILYCHNVIWIGLVCVVQACDTSQQVKFGMNSKVSQTCLWNKVALGTVWAVLLSDKSWQGGGYIYQQLLKY